MCHLLAPCQLLARSLPAPCRIVLVGLDPKKVLRARVGSTSALHGHTWAPLEPSWGRLGAKLGHFGANFGCLGPNLSPTWPNLDEFGAMSVAAWSKKTFKNIVFHSLFNHFCYVGRHAILGPIWLTSLQLWPAWDQLGLILHCLGPSFVYLEASLGSLGVSHPGTHLGGQTAIFAPTWALLELCWSQLGRFQGNLEPTWTNFGPTWTALE